MAEPIPPPTPAQLVTIRALLISLGSVAKLFFAVGIVACVEAFSQAFLAITGGILGGLPIIGGATSALIHRLSQAISNKLGGLELKLDARYGGYYHNFAIALGKLMDGEAEAGWATWLIAKVVHATRAVVHTLPSAGSVTNRITRVTKTTKVITQKVVHVTKVAAHAAPGSIVHQVGALAGEIGHVIEWDIPHLRNRARSIENRLARLYEALRAEKTILVGTAFAGAVAVALGRLGLGWLRCSSVTNIGKKVGCGGFGLLDELLGAAIVSFAALDICDFAAAAESVAETFVPELMTLVDVEDALIGCHGATAAPLLALPRLHLPPDNLGLPLAA